jgi:hypothetical protein
VAETLVPIGSTTSSSARGCGSGISARALDDQDFDDIAIDHAGGFDVLFASDAVQLGVIALAYICLTRRSLWGGEYRDVAAIDLRP